MQFHIHNNKSYDPEYSPISPKVFHFLFQKSTTNMSFQLVWLTITLWEQYIHYFFTYKHK